MGVTRGWLPWRAGSPIPVGGRDATAVPPQQQQQQQREEHYTGSSTDVDNNALTQKNFPVSSVYLLSDHRLVEVIVLLN